MSKSYFGQLDSRNTKYQGYINKNSRNGIGILLDEFLVFYLSHWTNDQPNGPSFIIYPKREIFFGNIISQRPSGVCCFIPNKQYSLYANFDQSGQTRQIAIWFTADNTVYKSQLIKTSNIQNSQQKRSTIMTQVSLKQIYECHSDKEAFQAIEKSIGKVKPQMRSIWQYIQTNFEEKSDSLIQVANNRIGFKDIQTIGAKFEKNLVKNLGLYSKTSQNLQMGRQYSENKDGSLYIQQGMFKGGQMGSQIFSYRSDQSRPVQAIKILQQFFRKSTTFQNKYTKLSFADEIFRYFSQQVCKSIQILNYQFAQQILQQSKPNDADEKNRMYNIQQVKRQILNKVNRKNNSMRTSARAQQVYINSFAYSRMQTPLRILQVQKSRSRSRKSSYDQFRKQSLNRRSPGSSPTRRSPTRRSPLKYNYLDQANNQKEQFLDSQNYHNRNIRARQQMTKLNNVNSYYRPNAIASDRVETHSPFKYALDPNIINHFTLNKVQQQNAKRQPYKPARSEYLQDGSPYSEYLNTQQKRRAQLRDRQLQNLEKQRKMFQRQKIAEQQIKGLYYNQFNQRRLLNLEQQQLNISNYKARNQSDRHQYTPQIDYTLKSHNRYIPFSSSNANQILNNRQRRQIFQRQFKVSPSFRRNRNMPAISKSPITFKREKQQKIDLPEQVNRQNIQTSPIKRRYKYVE